MTRTPDELIQHARTHQLIHSKTTNWCSLEEILEILKQKESTPVEQNVPEGKFYKQKIRYQGYEFIAATPEPITYPAEKV